VTSQALAACTFLGALPHLSQCRQSQKGFLSSPRYVHLSMILRHMVLLTASTGVTVLLTSTSSTAAAHADREAPEEVRKAPCCRPDKLLLLVTHLM